MPDAKAILTPVAVVTTAVTVQMYKINYYNATSGALAPALPALSGQSVGATATVVKWEGDVTGNAVTVTCAGADTFYGGATTEILNSSGLVRTLQVISVASVKYWAKLDGWGGGGGGGGGGLSPSIVDAKGDLLVATADNTIARKAVGANGTWFKADSTTGDGTAWDTVDIVDVVGLSAALASLQTLDGDLTAIAGISATNDDVIQRKSGLWTNRNLTQLKTDMSLDNVDNTSDSAKWAAVKTLTNTRLVSRVVTITSSATPAINTDVTDVFGITALTVPITSMTSSLTGTPNLEEELRIFIIGTAARTIAWGSGFEDGPMTLPLTTVGTQRLDILFYRNGVTSKWRCYAANSA